MSRVGLGDTRGKGHICMPDCGPQGVPARVKGKKRKGPSFSGLRTEKGKSNWGERCEDGVGGLRMGLERMGLGWSREPV